MEDSDEGEIFSREDRSTFEEDYAPGDESTSRSGGDEAEIVANSLVTNKRWKRWVLIGIKICSIKYLTYRTFFHKQQLNMAKGSLTRPWPGLKRMLMLVAAMITGFHYLPCSTSCPILISVRQVHLGCHLGHCIEVSL